MSAIKRAKKNSKRTKEQNDFYKAGVFAGADAVKEVVCDALNSEETVVYELVGRLKLELDSDGNFVFENNKGMTNQINRGAKKDKNMQYYELKIKPSPALTIEKPTFKRITSTEALDPSRDVFAVKGKRFKVGQKVKVYNIYDGFEKGEAKVIEIQNGLPWKIEFDNGTIETVLGLIIQIIPLLSKLWEAIKGVFKKK